MTLDEFQANKSLKEEAAKNGIVRALIDVLKSESVVRMGRSGQTAGRPPDDKIESWGKVQGFNDAIMVLESCIAAPRPVIKDIPSTYAPVNPPVQTVVQRKPREKK